MDNKMFNVNGRGKEPLCKALYLLFSTEYFGDKEPTVAHFSISKEKGFILHSWPVEGKTRPFLNLLGEPEPVTVPKLADVLFEWLSSQQAKEVSKEQWEENIDTDGSTSEGWRVYVEEWGHIKEGKHSIDHSTIGAIKMVYLWYGK